MKASTAHLDHKFVSWSTAVHAIEAGTNKTKCGHAIPNPNKVGPVGYYKEYHGAVCENCVNKSTDAEAVGDAWQRAKRNSRYGHRVWVCWKRGAVRMAEVATVESIKAAIMDSGVFGNFSLVSSGTFSTIGSWRMMVTTLRNARVNAIQN